MEWWIAGGIGLAIVAFAVVAQLRGWIDLTGKHARGRGGGVAGLVGGVDEVFAPMRYEAQKTLETETELPAPAPVPGDGDKDIFRSDGKVRIDLDQ